MLIAVGGALHIGWFRSRQPGDACSGITLLCSTSVHHSVHHSAPPPCSAPSHSLLQHHSALTCSLHSASNSDGQNTSRGSPGSGQPAKPPIRKLLTICKPLPSHHLLFSNLVSEGGDGRGLGFAMPHLRGKDESDGAVAAADAGNHGSGRLGAEADGVASQLDGGRSQRGDPRPGPT